jgi:peptide/nickel transport system permease protein
MFYFIARRSFFAVILLFVVSIFTFWIFSALPADPAALTCGKNCRPEVIEANRARLGYDKPFIEQYGSYMKGIFAGRTYGEDTAGVHCSAPSLGYSYDRHECVTSLVAKTLPVTASIAVGAFVLWMGLGISLGTFAALRRGRWPDHFATVFSVIGISFPSFFLGLLSILIFVIWTSILPFPQYVGITENPFQWFTALILPWTVLAVLSASTYIRMTRNGILEVMNEEFVRLGIAKGLPRRTLIVKYVLRAALTPIATIAGIDLAFLLGGALVTESVFNLPGLGKLTLAAVVNSDLPILVATTLVAAVFIVVANAVVDILYGFLDPRVRTK